MDGTHYLYLHNRKLTWKLIEQVLSFVITVNIRSKILSFIFHSHILYLFFEVIEFFKFSYLLFVYTTSFLSSDKNEYWILKYHMCIVLFCNKEKKTIKIISVLLPIYSIFRVFQFKSVPLLLQNYKIHLWNVSYKWKTFVYAKVLFMDTHISHYSGIFDLRYACQLVSLYTREINKTTYFSEFQYQRNSCFHSMEFLESNCIDENKKKKKEIYNRLILLHYYCSGKVTRIFFQVLYRNNFNIVLLEKRAYFIFNIQIFLWEMVWYI